MYGTQVGGITLNPTKASSRAYDGRYDQYIMTDSEEETDLIDETKTVAYVAESVCILAIGCVAGLKGLSRMRKGVSCRNVSPQNENKNTDSVGMTVYTLLY